MKKQPKATNKKKLLAEAGDILGLPAKDVEKMEPISDAQVDLIMSTFEVYINQAEQVSKNKQLLQNMGFKKTSLNSVYTIIKDAQQASKAFASFKNFVHKI